MTLQPHMEALHSNDAGMTAGVLAEDSAVVGCCDLSDAAVGHSPGRGTGLALPVVERPHADAHAAQDANGVCKLVGQRGGQASWGWRAAGLSKGRQVTCGVHEMRDLGAMRCAHAAANRSEGPASGYLMFSMLPQAAD